MSIASTAQHEVVTMDAGGTLEASRSEMPVIVPPQLAEAWQRAIRP
ncbi:hypothetical protein H5407_19770 [Mitsuaria sp. WAJ17]|nr:hypothetical protein [Mitsuaria sp. WAJ17]MBB2487478.1 hypothetical protein [Mitsuaria sp. WAJ17]